MSVPVPDTTRQMPSADLPRTAVSPYLGLLTATVAVSFSAILIKLSSAAPLVIAAYRLAITSAILLVLLRPAHLARIRRLPRQSLALMALSGLLLALHFGFWTASLSYTSVASSVLFVSVHPALVAGIAWALFGERLSRMAVLGLLLTIAGSAIIAGGDLRLGGDALRGDLLAFLGAVVFAGYLLIGRRTRRQLDNLSYSAPVYTVCTVVLVLAALLFGQSLAAVSGRDLLVFLGLAVICTLGGHLLYNWTLRYISAAVVSVSFLGEPIGASLLAWALLGQRVPLGTMAGGAVVLIGIWLTARG